MYSTSLKVSACYLHLKRRKERDCTLGVTPDLRIVFDNFITWKADAVYVRKKVAPRVSIVELIRGFVTTKVSVPVYNTILLPIFYHCDIAWSKLLQKEQYRLHQLQNISARIIAFVRSYGASKLVTSFMQALLS